MSRRLAPAARHVRSHPASGARGLPAPAPAPRAQAHARAVTAMLAMLASLGLARADASPSSAPAASARPDPAVEDAGDANLEPEGRRRGVVFAARIGGGMIIGVGLDDSVGRGGSVGLRLGHVATRRTVLTFELSGTAALHRSSMTSGTSANTNTLLVAGAQYYLNPSFWIRAGGGLGVYQGRDVELPGGTRGTLQLAGPAVLGGLGIDLLRFKWAVLGVEFATAATITGDGTLIASGIDLGLTFD